METWPVLKGLLTRVPFLYRTRAAARGGSISARYCYSVWLRHLAALRAVGLDRMPESVAELGPGLSLGVGLAALLSGSTRYAALEVSRDAAARVHGPLVDELAALVAGAVPVPDDTEFPEVLPRLPRYDFPVLQGLVPPSPARVAQVKALLAGISEGRAQAGAMALTYEVPWTGTGGDAERVELVLAQAVLEHVADPRMVYDAMAARLGAGGFLSITIDFRSHGLTRRWNAHWTYGPRAWRQVQGARPWGLNRWVLAGHLEAMAAAGFRVLTVQRVHRASDVPRAALAPGFDAMSDLDLETSGAYVAAVRC